MKKRLFPFLFLFLCFFLNSCSRMDLAVQFAGTYVANKADNYFDLTGEQSKWLKQNFEKDFSQVKKVIFPQMAAELGKAADIVMGGAPVEPSVVKLSYERMKNLLYEGLRMFSSDAVAFADKLNPGQVVYFQKEFNEKLSELKEKESPKESYKKMKKQFDSWAGSLTHTQKTELENFTNSNPPVTAEKIQNRQLLAQEFVRAFPVKESRTRFVSKLTNSFDQVYENKFSPKAKERNNRIIVFVTSFLNRMTKDQRSVLVETLRDRANQLIKISRF